MDIEKFKESSTGKLIKAGINYWAFIPNPLPPAGLDKFSAEFVEILSGQYGDHYRVSKILLRNRKFFEENNDKHVQNIVAS